MILSSKVRKGVAFSLFKDDFTITLYHKPSMGIDDKSYYMVLDSLVLLKFRIIDQYLIIDSSNILNGSNVVINSFFEKLVTLLINQDKFTTLVTIIGNNSKLYEECKKRNAPVVENAELTHLPLELYNRIKGFYNNNPERYGFYLLSVTDKLPIQPINIPKKFESLLTQHYPDIKISESNNHMRKIIEINGVSFEYGYYDEYGIVISNLKLINDDSSYISMMRIIEQLENFLVYCDKMFITAITSEFTYKLCRMREYPSYREPLPVKLHNSMGTFKIVKKKY